MSRPSKEGPLKGVKIIDLSRLLPGPLATQMLADMGADVIKLEDPKALDYARNMAPHYNGIGMTYLALNRSKESIAIDLGSEKGKKIYWDLVKTADIVIDSFRPGVLEKLGIDYTTATQHKADIIYVSVSGYGHQNILAQKAGHDINYLGHAGVLATNGTPDKIIQTGVQIADIAGGSYPAVMACLSALFQE
jgi:alpha-methylacyl-CoA racemase